MPPLTTTSSPVTSPVTMPGADPLATLRDIHLPDPVSAAPAYGWWLLGMALVLLLAGAVLGWRQWRKRTAYRRAALQLLQRSDVSLPADKQLQALNQLLKRTALCAYPQQPVAQMHGSSWSEFLQQSLGKKACDGSACFGEQLYQQDNSDDLSTARRFAAHWIRHHRPLPLVTTTREAAHA